MEKSKSLESKKKTRLKSYKMKIPRKVVKNKEREFEVTFCRWSKNILLKRFFLFVSKRKSESEKGKKRLKKECPPTEKLWKCCILVLFRSNILILAFQVLYSVPPWRGNQDRRRKFESILKGERASYKINIMRFLSFFVLKRFYKPWKNPTCRKKDS